ncbi:MAG: HD domain-containing protein [Candidatus Omnitrophota bacterium]|nr:HD domain-containing protein [Candidatus Omnitrophota bacterium]
MAEGSVLVVSDDSALSYHAKKDLTRQNFNVIVEANEALAMNMAKTNNFDVIILSIKGDNLEHSRLLLDIKSSKLDSMLIVASDSYSVSSISDMQRFGIFGFLPSSLDQRNLFLIVKQAVFVKKVRNIVKIHEEKILSLEKQIVLLNKKVEDGAKNTVSLYRNLQESYIGSVKALAQALDARDGYTHSHSQNVAKYAVVIAEEMGLSVSEIKDIRDACELHDIGKIGIRDAILSKEGPLTDSEWRQMREHPLKGAQILKSLDLKNVLELVKQHHEHYDGSGYPEGKKNGEILLGARIVSLADAYDAMCSARAYKNKYFSKAEAVEEIKRSSGKQFDPRVVEAFLRVIDRIQ